MYVSKQKLALPKYWIPNESNGYFKHIDRKLTIRDLCYPNNDWRVLYVTDEDEKLHPFDLSLFTVCPLSQTVLCTWKSKKGRFFPDYGCYLLYYAAIVVLEPCTPCENSVIALFDQEKQWSSWKQALSFQMQGCAVDFHGCRDALIRRSLCELMGATLDASYCATIPLLNRSDYVTLKVDEKTGEQRLQLFDPKQFRQVTSRFNQLQPCDPTYVFVSGLRGFWSEVHCTWIIVLRKETNPCYYPCVNGDWLIWKTIKASRFNMESKSRLNEFPQQITDTITTPNMSTTPSSVTTTTTLSVSTTPTVTTTTPSVTTTTTPSVTTTTTPSVTTTTTPSVTTTTTPNVRTTTPSAPTAIKPNVRTTTPNIPMTTPNISMTTTPNEPQTTPSVPTTTPSVPTTTPSVPTTTPSVPTTTPSVSTTTPSVSTTTPSVQTTPSLTTTTPSMQTTTENVSANQPTSRLGTQSVATLSVTTSTATPRATVSTQPTIMTAATMAAVSTTTTTTRTMNSPTIESSPATTFPNSEFPTPILIPTVVNGQEQQSEASTPVLSRRQTPRSGSDQKSLDMGAADTWLKNQESIFDIGDSDTWLNDHASWATNVEIPTKSVPTKTIPVSSSSAKKVPSTIAKRSWDTSDSSYDDSSDTSDDDSSEPSASNKKSSKKRRKPAHTKSAKRKCPEKKQVTRKKPKPSPKKVINLVDEYDEEDEGDESTLGDFIASDASVWEEDWEAPDSKQKIPYDVSKDQTTSPELDNATYSDCREQTPNQKVQYYDGKGKLLVNKSAEELMKHTRFICPGNGSVCCVNNRDLGLFWCTEHDGEEGHAPGKIVGFLIDPENLDVNLHVQWLTRNKVYYDTHEPHETTNADAFFAEPCDMVPLYWYRAQLVHMSRKAQEDHIMDYISVYREYTMLDNSPLLRHWSCDNMSSANRADDIIDVLDLLEFYHIAPKFIWRSRLGRFVWKTYIANFVDFGKGPNIALVGQLMSTDTWTSTQNSDSRGDTCVACQKREVGCTTVYFQQHDDEKSGNFGSVCLKRMRYLHSIGACMRNFRTKPFDATQVQKLVPQLRKLHSSFHANQT